MAEIRVEEKRGLNWLWVVIALVVIGLVAWFLFAQPRTEDLPATAPADTIPASLEWRNNSPLLQRIA